MWYLAPVRWTRRKSARRRSRRRRGNLCGFICGRCPPPIASARACAGPTGSSARAESPCERGTHGSACGVDCGADTCASRVVLLADVRRHETRATQRRVGSPRRRARGRKLGTPTGAMRSGRQRAWISSNGPKACQTASCGRSTAAIGHAGPGAEIGTGISSVHEILRSKRSRRLAKRLCGTSDAQSRLAAGQYATRAGPWGNCVVILGGSTAAGWPAGEPNDASPACAVPIGQ